MKYRFVTLFLPFCLFVFSANRAEACGSDNTEYAADFHQKAAKESCCATNEKQSDCCTGDIEHQSADPDCPCDHDNGGCHCPGCQIVIHFSAAFTLEVPPAFAVHVLNFSVQKQAFYFADHLPEAVYLPIWQPPKIGA